MKIEKQQWWGERPAQVGDIHRLEIGPMSLWIRRDVGGLTLLREQTDTPLSQRLQVCSNVGTDGTHVVLPSPTPESIYGQYAAALPDDLYGLGPKLADRPVVVRSECPLHAWPGSTLTVFVESPVWLTLSVAEQAGPLVDEAICPPSLTWFGPNTRLGELCYASRTEWQQSLEEAIIYPHRATTMVTLSHVAAEPLALTRLKVPVPHLSVFADADGRLWTQDVSFEYRSDQSLAQLELTAQPPRHAPEATLVASPRVAANGGGLRGFRFGSFWS